jgi:haloacetate dehalogenase
MALDNGDVVRTFTSLDVMPSKAAFDNMDSDLAFAWFHWHLMRQPEPLPETLIGNSAQFYLDYLLERWTGVKGSISSEAYAEYLRCFSNPQTIRATCADYRAIELDLIHDEADQGKTLNCPMLVLWGSNTAKRPGWQTGRSLDMLTAWRERATRVRGRAIDCGHFLAEEAPDEIIKELFEFLPVM